MPRLLYRSTLTPALEAKSEASHSSKGSLYEQVGGAAGLRQIIDRFVDRAFGDTMIGFLFHGADRERIKRLEFEFAAQHLGGPAAYTGRPLQSAHQHRPIERGHFDRRLQLLRVELERASAPRSVVEHWLGHTEARRKLVQTPRLACGPTGGGLKNRDAEEGKEA